MYHKELYMSPELSSEGGPWSRCGSDRGELDQVPVGLWYFRTSFSGFLQEKEKRKSPVRLNIEVWTCDPAGAPDWTAHCRRPVIDWWFVSDHLSDAEVVPTYNPVVLMVKQKTSDWSPADYQMRNKTTSGAIECIGVLVYWYLVPLLMTSRNSQLIDKVTDYFW